MGRGGNSSNLMYGSLAPVKEDDNYDSAEMIYQRWLDAGKQPNFFQASILINKYLTDSLAAQGFSYSIKNDYQNSEEYKWLNNLLSEKVIASLAVKQSMPRWEDDVLKLIEPGKKEKTGGVDRYPLSVSLVNKMNAASLDKYMTSFDQYTVDILNNYQKKSGQQYPTTAKMIAYQAVDLVVGYDKLEKVVIELGKGCTYNPRGLPPEKLFSKQVHMKYKQNLAIYQLLKFGLFNRQASVMFENIATNQKIVNKLQTVIFNHCQNYENIRGIPEKHFHALALALLSGQDKKCLQTLINDLRIHSDLRNQAEKMNLISKIKDF